MAQGRIIKSKFIHYVKALTDLKVSIEFENKSIVKQDPALERALKNSTIHCFKVTYEVLWKLIKHIAEDRDIKCLSPKDAFKAGFKMELISEEFETIFTEMVKKEILQFTLITR